MEKPFELAYTELKKGCFPEELSFRTTAEIKPLEGVIGQERAVKAFDFGLAVKMKGYNIYMAGPSGTGKTTYARNSTEKLAQTEPVPYDWCYVYNFQNPRSPLALRFEPGQGKQFKEDMAELVQLFKTELQKAFRAEDYETQKNTLEHSFDEKRDALMAEMSAVAEQYSFQVKTTNAGVFFMPVVEGKAVGEDEYDDLSEDVKNKIEKNSQMVQEKAGSIMRELRDMDKESKRQTDQLDYKTVVWLGVFQLIAAVFPGTSRSGATIIGALLLGVSRVVAAEFTFYLAIPVMFGASLLKLVKFLMMGLSFTSMELAILAVGCIVSFVVSIIVIKFLMGYIKKHDFIPFGIYRIVLGAVLLIYFALVH